MKFKLFIVGALVLASCSPKTTSDTKETSMSFPNTQVEEGYNLHAQNCAKCHKLKTINKYTREQWDKILPSMARKARISAEQEASINEYVNWELSKK
ncbi:MAG: hypothetical protein M9916_12750 [Crocinitomicaceae bacterium]|nr:hypothetical protein [Crocinitomicaceae bacterium]